MKKSTLSFVQKLRKLMADVRVTKGTKLDAYIIPSTDSHGSEYLCDADKRRAFISGFDGSAGTAIVTQSKALMWTDGRYFLQAEAQMDENWTLMKMGTDPDRADWINDNLESGAAVGFDPLLMSVTEHATMKSGLSSGVRLVSVDANLVDMVWGAEQPSRPDNPVVPLELQFCGEDWEAKIARIRQEMEKKKCDLLVLSALDEIAWTLNLRGSDIPNNPVFFSYLCVSMNNVFLFINETQMTEEVRSHFKPSQSEANTFQVLPYESIRSFIKGNNLGFKKMWFSNNTSFAIAESDSQKVFNVTPPCLMKAIKNETELKGFELCHIRDGAALCAYFSWLEKNVAKGSVTEISGAKKLLEFRKEMQYFVQPSFDTISSVGPNAAVIHYRPTEQSDRTLTCEELYLVDSGGQYKDGTTDVTRTLHFGTPTDFEKECFTRVLKGQIHLATANFPEKTIGSRLDSIARMYLWEVGLDYKHGTGHGVGSYLNVHEGPMGISWRAYPDDPGLQSGMVLSDEPGYYLDGKFGIRLENLVKVVQATDVNHKQHSTSNFLTFETLTLAPIQAKMIVPDLLNKKEVDFLNDYHEMCREKVVSLLKEIGNTEALSYLLKETEPLG